MHNSSEYSKINFLFKNIKLHDPVCFYILSRVLLLFLFLLPFIGALSHGKAIEELCLPFSYNSFYKFIGALFYIYIYIYSQEISVFYITLENK